MPWAHLAFELLVVALIVVGVVIVVRALTHRPTSSSSSAGKTPALTELDLRYARGEISREEFLQRRADLLGLASPLPLPPPAAPSA